MDKKTPLYDCHIESGGKMVPFAGYILPIQYKNGVIAEHMAVRNACGIFDVSHMGEIEINGTGSLDYINYVLTNDFSKMIIGQVKYSPMCNFKGGVIDDLLVYKMDENRYLLVPNASNKNKVLDWLVENKKGDIEIYDKSDEFVQIALQGPKAERILSKFTSLNNIPEKYYTFKEGGDMIISKTGYTGEDGYEIYCSKERGKIIWDKLLEVGIYEGLIPCGLGARDTLRLEAGMPLYGHEMNEEVSPLTAGLGFAVKLGKENFIGKKAIEDEILKKGKRVGLKIIGRGIAREKCGVYVGDIKIGETTSGTYLPYLEGAYAMAIIDENVDVNAKINVDIRGKKVEAQIVDLPFYKKKERN